ncbi:MAG: DEAD/DEAH box helicase [Leptolyngbya sp. UWPOB_LEPTO1]|uniref:DEAD/DEAH box helicase n=1 Tax=Leptolyngbya sp. UWPOB_LEPTO1 TaxID=2815653 RepID=UPI001AC2BA4B|nr:DEAD/DEAH box helicase [Leptolyngbya sp. UWPOB_LEPTO1]MBN8561189.1 DEAD/DEAH box helicase [Leptolyngbya sp. UWPOB_LEPTO1]
MQDPYYRLAPFIQEYIYAQGWSSLRPIQAEACRVLFDTDQHLLIAAGTASGKTEAAFLPALTLLHENPSRSVGAIYISPIKALINDQFDRLTDLLRFADLPVWAWHGDVSQSRKKKLLANPRGILQITPESLESLLINKSSDIDRIFGDLRFVIIDEVHAFIGSDRGCQILCQLSRLAKLTGNQPRRIGLSATLGDYSLAEAWLRADTSPSVTTPKIEGAARKIQLSIEHFYDPGLVVRAKGDTRDRVFNPYHLYLFQQTEGRKSLIFANGRTATEEAIAALREIAQAKGAPDIYHVHHGSISAALRETAEEAMRDGEKLAVTAATVTFEMGIDLGHLDRVLQLEAPASVASFLQRLGRSGRRGDTAEMRFVCAEDKPTGEEILPEQIPWQLLQAIAIIQLYIEEKWIEPAREMQYPFSLLYHQTMSTLAALGELSPGAIAQNVLKLPPFQSVTQDDFRLFLRHLIEIDHLEQTPTGGLIIGITAEKIINNFKFYAIFPDTEEYLVKHDGKAVGSIIVPPMEGDRFSLAGKTWEVIEVNAKKKTIVVIPSTKSVTSSSWRGSMGEIHTRVLRRMRKVLQETTMYPYLQPGAKRRLQEARELAQYKGFLHQPIQLIEEDVCCILPWMGTIPFRTLERFLRFYAKDALGLKSIKGRSPYFLIVRLGKCKLETLDHEIRSLANRRLEANMLLPDDEIPKLQKFDPYIPSELLRKSFMSDYLDLKELTTAIAKW